MLPEEFEFEVLMSKQYDLWRQNKPMMQDESQIRAFKDNAIAWLQEKAKQEMEAQAHGSRDQNNNS